jgi:hypothetical protein
MTSKNYLYHDTRANEEASYFHALTDFGKVCYNNAPKVIEDFEQYFPEIYEQVLVAILQRVESRKTKGVLLAGSSGRSAA